MRGDFSSFWKKEEKRNFNGVLHQQGRVLLDRDWNAQTEIFNDWQETAAADIIGAGVAAVPADAADGFKVINAEIKNAPDGVEITVKEGRVWADGLLIELRDDDKSKDFVVREATYFEPPIQSDDLPKNVRDAVILEAWHEELNAFQQPNLLIEPALGGVDTTERFQTAYRFRLFRMDADDTCDSIINSLKDNFDDKAKLTAVLKPDIPVDGDCPVVQGGGYTGFEHQLYRVEIAQTKHLTEAYFKWSQFNGGLVGRGTFNNQKVKIDANLNAILHSGLTSFYLETLEEINGYWQVTFGAKVALDTNTNSLNLPTAAADVFFSNVAAMNGKKVFFRLWDDIRLVSEFIAEDDLQDGIRLQFDSDAIEKNTPHDFWTFTVRTDDVLNLSSFLDNPQILLDEAKPQGIFYHRVPLAELDWTDGENQTAEIEDCRRIFPPLTKLKGCCTYRVGDGINSHGDFTNIQDAIDALPKSGGQICVLPGEYRKKIKISSPRNRNISIKGCGKRTRIIAEDNGAAIHVLGGVNLKIESLTVMAQGGGIGIWLQGDEITANKDDQTGEFGSLRNIKLENLRIIAANQSAIKMHIGQYVSIRGCQIFIRDENSDWQSAVYLAGDDLLFEENEIRVLTGGMEKPPNENIILKSDDKKIRFGKTDDPQAFHPAEKANGGLHLAGGCERVRVINNLIIGGTGNGITLGSIDVKKIESSERHVDWRIRIGRKPDDCEHNPGVVDVTEVDEGTRLIAGEFLRDILIENNRIFSMGLNGIGVDGFFPLEPPSPNNPSQKSGGLQFITVENLVILGNRIEFCLNKIATDFPNAAAAKYVGYGGIALSDVGNLVVRDNFIRNNGTNFLEPTCGIFILRGRGIEISRNHILNNGRQTDIKLDGKIKPGARGGIFIFSAVEGTMQIGHLSALRQGQSNVVVRPNGVPALKLHENIVAVPVGRALTLRSTGNVSITDNQFLTQSIAEESDLLSLMAASVLIFSLNTAAGNSSLTGYLKARQGETKMPYNGSQMKYATASGNNAGLEELQQIWKGFGKSFLSGSIQFADNQCDLLSQIVRRNLAAISAILILSLDDVGFLGNQTNCVMDKSPLLADTIIFGSNVRASDNSWRETPESVKFSAVTFSEKLNTTTDNHSTHCLLVHGKLFLDRFNLTEIEAATFSGNNDIVEIFKKAEGKLPCRPNRKVLSNYGNVRELAVKDFKTTPEMRNIDG